MGTAAARPALIRQLNPSSALAAPHNQRIEIMLYWAVVFFVVAIIAGVFGFGGIASASAGIAQLLFVIFLALFVIAMVARALKGRTP